MRQFTKAIALMAVSAMTLTSCGDEALWSGPSDEGAVKLNLTSDGRVMRQTRADDSQSPVVPDVSSFGVNFAKIDGTYSKSWNNVEAFNREKSFPIGDYKITATYGDLNREGFDNPCYSGSNDVHVSPGDESTVNVTATLANSMVSIRYKEEFTKLYSAYSAAVQTEGHEWVIFAQNEDRPAYVAPSEEVKLKLTLTNEAGDRVEIQPASFRAEARHHYVVTIGVNGSVSYGDLALDIEFDDDVVAETVPVSLGDELFSAPAPTITAKDFDPETPVATFEYAELKSNPEFHVFAFGGFRSATLNVISDGGYSPVFGNRVELVGADDLTNQQLESAGVGAYFRNAEKMGLVNIKSFLEKLPAGQYTIEISATDVMTRTTEPVKLTANITPLEIELKPAANAEFMGEDVAVDLSTNCPDIKNVVMFKVPDANNRLVDAEIKSVTDVTASGASARAAAYTFRYVLGIAPAFRTEIKVEASLAANRNKKAETSVLTAEPNYTVVADAFSDRVVLKIDAERDDIVKALVDNIRIYNSETQVPSANLSYDAKNGMITVRGLVAGTTYPALKVKCGTFEKSISAFTTEVETNVPNGSFNEATQTINISNVQIGGDYRVSPVDYTLKSSIQRSEPIGWASLNQKTCWTGSSNKNTWFLVPSTFVDNGAVVIRSVGYNHNGTTPARSGGAFNTKYYCENAPTDAQLDKSTGELFLGSYSFDNGAESRNDGIDFTSRPSTLSFDYSYSSVNGEKGEVSVKILDSSASVLVEKSVLLDAAAATTNKTINISGYPFGKKASKIVLCFKSTQTGKVPTINIPSGSALNEGLGLGNKTTSANSYKAFAKGSELVVDNVKLGYGSSNAARSAKGKRR